MNKMLIRLTILLAVIGMVAGGYYLVQQIPEDESTIALAEVKRGDLVVKTFLRGELRAVRSNKFTFIFKLQVSLLAQLDICLMQLS